MIEVTQRELMERIEWQERMANRNMKADPLIVFLHTPLCGTCAAARKMIDIVEHIEQDMNLLSADVNFLPSIVERFQIRSVPALLVVPSKPRSVPQVLYRMGSVQDIITFLRSAKL
ncbi:thiol-disulfide isomerase [Bacillus sp. FJAT-18019]|nr:thiol-disulfide isomerase [Bacillus sp. FJAT-18019]